MSYCLLLEQRHHGNKEGMIHYYVTCDYYQSIVAEVFRLEFNVIDIGLCGIAVVFGIVYFITKVTLNVSF